ncbi:hypothetical protein Ahy_Scaffold1g106884 isoform A [Arachis hypogaea]|uniref:Aminotransferase-like plant mobile domain-containing protein n=1 Tax=Arachis hypogaea TaxID=3818 RepID=A0A444WT07_ARAHY|nr:hypothetical protein Ahy_Scaffold1g106884 isoform A [Arachis hypogaea]
MPFGECTITLQDVAYQLGLAVDGRYVSSCLTDFHIYIEGGRPAWDTVRRYARAYIMMLLGTQLFADKSGNRIYIRWLPYVARLEEMGSYSWESTALAWLYRCMCRVANRHVVKLAGPLQLLQSWIFWRFPRFRPAGYDTCSWPLASRWSGYNPSVSEKAPRVQMWRLQIDMLQPRDFIWMLYSSPEVLHVIWMSILMSLPSCLLLTISLWVVPQLRHILLGHIQLPGRLHSNCYMSSLGRLHREPRRTRRMRSKMKSPLSREVRGHEYHVVVSQGRTYLDDLRAMLYVTYLRLCIYQLMYVCVTYCFIVYHLL